MESVALTQVDWLILAVVGASTLLGLWKGFVKEAVSVAGWVAGVVLAFRYSAEVGKMIPFDALGELGRTATGAVVILILSQVAFAVVGELLRLVIQAVTGGIGDRLLGSCFGFIRGALLVMAAVSVLSFPSAPTTLSWERSRYIPVAEEWLSKLEPLMPETMKDLASIAKKKQEAARAQWNANFRLSESPASGRAGKTEKGEALQGLAGKISRNR